MHASYRDGCEHKRRPSLKDQLVVGLLSLGIFLLVLALGLRAGQMVELVLILLATCAVVTINVLFAYSTWDGASDQGQESGQNNQQSSE